MGSMLTPSTDILAYQQEHGTKITPALEVTKQRLESIRQLQKDLGNVTYTEALAYIENPLKYNLEHGQRQSIISSLQPIEKIEVRSMPKQELTAPERKLVLAAINLEKEKIEPLKESWYARLDRTIFKGYLPFGHKIVKSKSLDIKEKEITDNIQEDYSTEIRNLYEKRLKESDIKIINTIENETLAGKAYPSGIIKINPKTQEMFIDSKDNYTTSLTLAHEFGHILDYKLNIVPKDITGKKNYSFFKNIETTGTKEANRIYTTPQLLEKEYPARAFAEYISEPLYFKEHYPEQAKIFEKALAYKSEINIKISEPQQLKIYSEKSLMTEQKNTENSLYNKFINMKITKNILLNPQLIRVGLFGIGIYGFGGSISVKEVKDISLDNLNKLEPKTIYGKIGINLLKKGIDIIPETPLGVAVTGTFFGVTKFIPKRLLDVASPIITGVGIAQIGTGLATSNLERIESGVLNVGLGVGGKLINYLKAPVILKKDILTSRVIANEDIALLLKGEQNINVGKYTITKIFPQRLAFINSRAEIIMEKINPFRVSSRGLADTELTYKELALKYPSGKLVTISEPKIILGKTDLLLTNEGKILAGLSSKGVKIPEIYLQSGTLNRKEPIIRALIKGEMEESSNLAKIDLNKLDKQTKEVIKDLLNIPKGKFTKEIPIENTMINDEKVFSKLKVIRERGFNVYDIAERPITINKGRIEVRGYTKVRKRLVKNIKEIPIENTMINDEKVFSKIKEEKLTKYKEINKLLKGDITSIQKSLGNIEYSKEYGLIEEERLIGKTGVRDIKTKELSIITRDLPKTKIIIEKSSRGRPERINVKTRVRTYNLPSSRDIYSDRDIKISEPKETNVKTSQIQNTLNKQKQIKEEVLKTGKNILSKMSLLTKNIPSPKLKSIKQTSLLYKPISKPAQFKASTSSIMKDLELSKLKGVSREVIKEIPIERNREVTKVIPKEISKEMTKEMSKEVTKVIPKQISKNLTKLLTKSIIKQIPKEHPITTFYKYPKLSLRESPPKTITYLKGYNRKIEKKKKKKKTSRDILHYTPDLTSIEFNIRDTIKKKDIKNLVRNPPELRTLLRVVR